VLVISAVVVW